MMILNSVEFLLFFFLVSVLTFAIPATFRWVMLLLASLFFYGSMNVYFLLPLFGSCLLDYFLGRKMAGTLPGKRKKFLIISD